MKHGRIHNEATEDIEEERERRGRSETAEGAEIAENGEGRRLDHREHRGHRGIESGGEAAEDRWDTECAERTGCGEVGPGGTRWGGVERAIGHAAVCRGIPREDSPARWVGPGAGLGARGPGAHRAAGHAAGGRPHPQPLSHGERGVRKRTATRSGEGSHGRASFPPGDSGPRSRAGGERVGKARTIMCGWRHSTTKRRPGPWRTGTALCSSSPHVWHWQEAEAPISLHSIDWCGGTVEGRRVGMGEVVGMCGRGWPCLGVLDPQPLCAST